jgi:hypothetical protein
MPIRSLVRGAGRGERRHGAVHVGGEDVDGAGGDRHLLVQPVAGEPHEDVVDRKALHELLTGLDAAHDVQALGARGAGLGLGRFDVRRVDQGGADHGLVAVDHDVHVGGVENAEVDLDGVRRGRAEQGVLGELERNLRAVGGGYAQAQRLDGQRDVVAVDVGHAARRSTVVLVQDAAGHDPELAPGLDARRRREGRDQRRLLVVVAVELGPDGVGDALGQRVPGLERDVGGAGQQLELAPVLDLVGAARRGLGQGLHDLAGVVGVGGCAHRVLQQEAAHRHAVGVDAANAARRLARDAAGPLRADRAADAALAELAAPVALGGHAVEDGVLASGAGALEHGVHRAVQAIACSRGLHGPP